MLILFWAANNLISPPSLGTRPRPSELINFPPKKIVMSQSLVSLHLSRISVGIRHSAYLSIAHTTRYSLLFGQIQRQIRSSISATQRNLRSIIGLISRRLGLSHSLLGSACLPYSFKMSSSEVSFPPSLISPTIAASFPDSYTIRPLERADYAKGFLHCLKVLSDVGEVTEEQFNERYDWVDQHGKGVHYHVVIEHESRIVGTGALIVERKLQVFYFYTSYTCLKFSQFFVQI